jgi:hypothetical protein
VDVGVEKLNALGARWLTVKLRTVREDVGYCPKTARRTSRIGAHEEVAFRSFGKVSPYSGRN